MNMYSRMVRYVLCFIIFTAAAVVCRGASPVYDQSPEQVKSAFIFNFIKFIEWPDEKLNTPDNTFCIGIIGRDPIRETLKSFESQTTKGKRVVFKQFQNLSEIDNCHVLYISPSMKDRTPTIIEHLRGKSVLTISHYEGFDTDGGILNFFIEQSSIHFIINNEMAKAEGLRISSKLLNLAVISNARIKPVSYEH